MISAIEIERCERLPPLDDALVYRDAYDFAQQASEAITPSKNAERLLARRLLLQALEQLPEVTGDGR
jgi:hypothetical protein